MHRDVWEIDSGIVFHSPTVYQERNEHSLLKDFVDEIPGYKNNDLFRKVLDDCNLSKNDMPKNLYMCYLELTNREYFQKQELELVKLWLNEVEKF